MPGISPAMRRELVCRMRINRVKLRYERRPTSPEPLDPAVPETILSLDRVVTRTNIVPFLLNLSWISVTYNQKVLDERETFFSCAYLCYQTRFVLTDAEQSHNAEMLRFAAKRMFIHKAAQ